MSKTYNQLDFYQRKIIDAYGVDEVDGGFTRQVETYKTDSETGVEIRDEYGKLKHLGYKEVNNQTLKESMDAYWASINQATLHEFKPPVTPHLFDKKPPNAPDTYPFLVKKLSYDAKDQKEINYMHKLIKALHRKDPSIGASLMSEIANNEILRREDPNNMINRKKTAALVASDLKRLMSRLKRKITYAVPVERPSIYIDTRKSTFDTGDYNVANFITPKASFSINLANDHHPGTRLQRYHDSVYSRARGMLRKIGNKQEAINQYRMRHMKREWDHYAAMFTMDFTRMPPGYDPLPPTNCWISKNNLKFLKLDRCYHQDLLSRPWKTKDYVYFDPTLIDDEAGYEAWKVWAEKEKHQYAKLCAEEFEKPSDWKVREAGDKNSPIWRTLQQQSKPYQLKELRLFKKDNKKRKAWVLPNAPCKTEKQIAQEKENARVKKQIVAQQAAATAQQKAAVAAALALAAQQATAAAATAQQKAAAQQAALLAQQKAEALAKDAQRKGVEAYILKIKNVPNLTELSTYQSNPDPDMDKLDQTEQADLKTKIQEAKDERREELRLKTLEQDKKVMRYEDKIRKAKDQNELNNLESNPPKIDLFAVAKQNVYRKNFKDLIADRKLELSKAEADRRIAERKAKEAAQQAAAAAAAAKEPFVFAKVTSFGVKQNNLDGKRVKGLTVEIDNIYSTGASDDEKTKYLAASIVKSIINSYRGEDKGKGIKTIILSPYLQRDDGKEDNMPEDQRQKNIKLGDYYKKKWGMHYVQVSDWAKKRGITEETGYKLSGTLRIKPGPTYMIATVEEMLKKDIFEKACGIGDTYLEKDEQIQGIDLTVDEFKDVVKKAKLTLPNGDDVDISKITNKNDVKNALRAVSSNNNNVFYFHRGAVDINTCITVKKCTKAYEDREKFIKQSLSTDDEVKWTVNQERTKLTYGAKTANKTTLDIKIETIKDLLRKCPGFKDGKCENLKLTCDKEHPEIIEKVAKELYRWIKNDPSVNVEQPAAPSEPFKLVADALVPSDIKLKLKGKEPLRKDNCARYTYVDKGKKWYLRTYKIKGNTAYDNVLNAIDGKGNTLKNIIPCERYETWTTDENKPNIISIAGKGEFTFPADVVLPDKQNENIYLQQEMGTALSKWIVKKYGYKWTDIDGNKQGNNGTKTLDDVNRTLLYKYRTIGGRQFETEMSLIFLGVQSALKEFHALDTSIQGGNRFLHRDIKLENMTIDENNVVRLFDFDTVIDNDIPLDGKYSKWKDIVPMTNGGKLMDRFAYAKQFFQFFNTETGISTQKRKYKDNSFLDRHQAAMMLLQLGGNFDWVGEYNWKTMSPWNDKNVQEYGPQRLLTEDVATFSPPELKDKYPGLKDKTGVEGGLFDSAFSELIVTNFWNNVLKSTRIQSGVDKKIPGPDLYKGSNGYVDGQRKLRADLFIEAGREYVPNEKLAIIFNMKGSLVKNIFKTLFTMSKDWEESSNVIDTSAPNEVISPMQFLSNARQPVFERVQIQSDYGDDEDLEALMEFDPTIDGENLEKLSPSSHISDAEFERMLNETTNYDALSEHIMRENQAYSDGSTDMEVEEDAKSVSSKHSSSSVGSVASQMSNMSAHSVASNMSNMSSHSVASNMSNMSAHSVASNMSAQSGISVASNLSEKSNASTMSNMSHHSYASNHSIESQEAYPTSEHSDQSFGKYSDVSYNQTSGYSNSSSHSSSESSGKEMGYNGLSETSDHGMSESSDHESSNESTGYHSSGGSSSNNHSYNSSSDTE